MVLKLLKKLLPSKFKKDFKDHLGVPSLSWTLKNLKKAGYNPGVVYDIGAYEGYWTRDFLEVFPEVNMYMFEAQTKKKSYLKSASSRNSNVHYAIALLGSKEGEEVYFVEEETGSHVLQNNNIGIETNRITSSLDTLAENNHWPLPDFLKLDVQGFELEVLKGGSKALKSAEFCLLEITVLDIGGGAPLLVEVVNFMQEHQFQAYDISQFIRRPFDKALWQIDMLFIKNNSKFITDKRWA